MHTPRQAATPLVCNINANMFSKKETFICHILVLCLKGVPEFFERSKGVPVKHESYQVGAGNFLA